MWYRRWKARHPNLQKELSFDTEMEIIDKDDVNISIDHHDDYENEEIHSDKSLKSENRRSPQLQKQITY